MIYITILMYIFYIFLITENCHTIATCINITLFSFFAGNQLTSCKNHILEFKENILHLKSTNKHNHEELLKTLTEMTHEIMQRGNQSENLGQCCFCSLCMVAYLS